MTPSEEYERLIQPSPPTDGSSFDDNYKEAMEMATGPLYDLAAACAWVAASVPGDHPAERLGDLGGVLAKGAAWILQSSGSASDLDKDAYQLRLDQAEIVLTRAVEGGSESAKETLEMVVESRRQFATFRAQDEAIEAALARVEEEKADEATQPPPPKKRRWFR